MVTGESKVENPRIFINNNWKKAAKKKKRENCNILSTTVFDDNIDFVVIHKLVTYKIEFFSKYLC